MALPEEAVRDELQAGIAASLKNIAESLARIALVLNRPVGQAGGRALRTEAALGAGTEGGRRRSVDAAG